MPRYKVAFSDRWLTGRWGFTDRVISELGGKALEPAGGHNAWQVPFDGSSFELGRFLTDALKIPLSPDARPGSVFEVEELEPEAGKPKSGKPKPGRPKRSTRSVRPSRRFPGADEPNNV